MKFSFLTGTLFLLISSLFTFAHAEKTHPDIEKLKTYRSYYHVQLESKTAHQFEVWYQFKGNKNFLEWSVFQVAANENDDTSRIQKSDYLSTHWFYAGSLQPPKNYTVVPVNLKSLEDGLKKAVRQNHSDVEVTDIQIHYLGKSARLLANEIVPISVNADTSKRLAIKGSRFYFADLVNGQLKASGSGGVGFTSLNLDLLDEEDTTFNWIDFVLPKQIEGSSLFSLDYESKMAPIYLKTKQQLMDQIIATARLLESGGSYDPSIEKVLEKQGTTLLPDELKQFLTLKVDVYGRTADFNDQLDQRIEFLVPVSDKPFVLEKEDTATGIKFTLAVNLLDKPEFVLSVVGSDGTSYKIQLPCEKEIELVKDGPRTIVNGFLHLENTLGHISLPGSGKYTQFDIYPDARVYPSRFTGP